MMGLHAANCRPADGSSGRQEGWPWWPAAQAARLLAVQGQGCARAAQAAGESLNCRLPGEAAGPLHALPGAGAHGWKLPHALVGTASVYLLGPLEVT
jgi:hypothetical protein